MIYVLYDADSIAFSACTCSKDYDEEGFERDIETVKSKIDESVHWVINSLEDRGVYVDAYKLFIGSSTNFRKIIYPEYKANRKERVKPPLLDWALDYMETELNAFRVDYMEADDIVLATKVKLEEDLDNQVIVAFIDKDLLQIEGTYFDYYYRRNEEDRLLEVSQEQAVQNLWCQMLTGDSSDNIITKKGVGIKTAQKILKGVDTHFGALRVVYAKYLEWFGRKGREKFILNYRLLRMLTNGVPTPKDYTMVI